jgi:hydroxypyruvate reductase
MGAKTFSNELKNTVQKLRAQARAIIDHAIAAVDPFTCVRGVIRVEQEDLVAPGLSPEYRIDLSRIDSVYVVGCGKAGARMSLAVEQVLGNRIVDGAVAIKYGHRASSDPGRIKLYEAGHPRPDENGRLAAQQAVALLDKAGPRDLVIALLSGGGSALWPLPVEGISLNDKRKTTEALLRCGATIHEINCVRKHLSAIKGGFAALHAAPARVLALVISDVIGNDLDAIASGPFVGDPTTFADAVSILKRYELMDRVPAPVLSHITQGADGNRRETPKPGDPAFSQVKHLLCADNDLALHAAAEKAAALGFRVVRWPQPLCGESQHAAEKFCGKALSLLAASREPFALIAGGETTVTLGDAGGTGGRNQEFALAASQLVNGSDMLVIASCGTDGTDGPTDAAGGMIDATTCSRGAAIDLDIRTHLDHHDSYHFLKKTGDLIVSGPTGTNVMDLQLALGVPRDCEKMRNIE